MTNIDARVVAGEGGLPKVVITAADGARAEVYLHGAHVSSWIPAGGSERLFVSATSTFRPGSAIRGGIPVIFPQFSTEGPLPKHGFARTSTWALVELSDERAETGRARFRLSSSPATEAIWPRPFVADLTIGVRGHTLDVELSVLNDGAEPLTFTAALHTYLALEDIRETIIRGLAGQSYRDTAAGGVLRTEASDRIEISGEVDRVYLGVANPVAVVEPARSMTVWQSGFTDVVVWNPGPDVGAKLADLEPNGYRRMLCIEAAAVGTPVVVAPRDTWIGRQQLEAR